MKPVAAADISDGVAAFSDGVTTTVTSSLMRSKAPVIRKITTLIRQGDFEAAKAEVRELEFTEGLKAVHGTVRRFVRNAALLGAGALDNPKTTAFANGQGYPYEIDTGAVNSILKSINATLIRDTRARLMSRINRAERFQKASEPIDPEKLSKDINRYLRGEIRRVVDVSTNLTGTRVSAYGMFYEARVRGIARYRIDAILDDRTTDICRSMNGRIFEVSTAYKRTQAILTITEPSDIKSVAPFPDLSEIEGLTNEELQAMGHDTPPFHFLCRTVVTMLSSSTEREVASSPHTSSRLRNTLIAAGASLGASLLEELTDRAADAARDAVLDATGLLARPTKPLAIAGPPDLLALPGPLAPAAQVLLPGAEPGEPVDLGLFTAKQLTTDELEVFEDANYGRYLASYKIPNGVLDDFNNDLVAFGRHLNQPDVRAEAPDAAALRLYTGLSYRPINNALRGLHSLSDRDQEVVTTIDRLLVEAPALNSVRDTPEFLVYRGASGSDIYNRLELGVVFQDDAYVSTSLSLSSASAFASPSGGTPGTLFRIMVPDSAHKLYLDPISSNRGEKELLLGRGSQFRVVGMTPSNGDDPHNVVDLVYIGQGARLDPELVGLAPLPEAENITRNDAPRSDRFAWKVSDIREAMIRG